jgi:hypothetical protein
LLVTSAPAINSNTVTDAVATAKRWAPWSFSGCGIMEDSSLTQNGAIQFADSEPAT